MTAPLTLIAEGKPLVFDVPVPVGEAIPAGTAFVRCYSGGRMFDYFPDGVDRSQAPSEDDTPFLIARPPVAPESFADGDVAWVRVERDEFGDWCSPEGDRLIGGSRDEQFCKWLDEGDAYLTPSPRPESLADVLDDANLPDDLRARIEKAVGANG